MEQSCAGTPRGDDASGPAEAQGVEGAGNAQLRG